MTTLWEAVMKSDQGRFFSRASALGLLGGAAGLLVGAAPMPASPATDSGACAVTPGGEIGPFFTDDSVSGFNRSDVRSNLNGTSTQRGVPLTLTVRVFDTKKACVPIAGLQVDLWHCNALGVYSDE